MGRRGYDPWPAHRAERGRTDRGPPARRRAGNTDASGAAVDYVDPDFTLDEHVAALEGIDIANDTNAQVTTAPEHMLFSSGGNHDAAMWNDVQSFGNGASLMRR